MRVQSSKKAIFNAEIDSMNYVIKGFHHNDIVDLLDPDIPKTFRQVIVNNAIKKRNISQNA